MSEEKAVYYIGAFAVGCAVCEGLPPCDRPFCPFAEMRKDAPMTITPPPPAAEPAPSVRAETLRTLAADLSVGTYQLHEVLAALRAAAADIERLGSVETAAREMFRLADIRDDTILSDADVPWGAAMPEDGEALVLANQAVSDAWDALRAALAGSGQEGTDGGH